MAYRPHYFTIKELVPEIILIEERDPWKFLDDRILRTGDRLRARYGPLTCNNWHRGGKRHESGFRLASTSTGARYSQHKFGRALDLISHNVSAEEIREEILAAPFHPDFEYITCIEIGVGWLHIDCRNWNKNKHGILKIHP